MKSVAWALHPDIAPVIRFMQDQPLIVVESSLWTSANFVHGIADWCEQLCRITDKQRASIERIIADRKWIEPPRWRPFAKTERDRYAIYVCPGAAAPEEIRSMMASCPDGIPGHVTIGGLNERSRDPVPRSEYVTIVWRLVAEARERGLIIGEDRMPPAFESISCFRHRQRPDWVRDPEKVVVPAGIDARVTPEPLKLLKTIYGGAKLRQRVGDWSERHLHMPDGSRQVPMTRALGRLTDLGFIERIGKLPPGYPDRVLEFDWRISAAGLGWLAANGHGSTSTPQKSDASAA